MTQAKITKDEIIEIYKKLQKEFDFKLVYKKDSKFMKFIAFFLSLFGILDKKKFMNDFTTTIGSTIYHSYKIGEGDEEQLWAQFRTLVHEIVHVRQCERFGFIKFSLSYLLSSNSRLKYEIQAYKSSFILNYAIYGAFPNAMLVAENLYSYNLKAEHVGKAALAYIDEIDMIKKDKQFSDCWEIITLSAIIANIKDKNFNLRFYENKAVLMDF